MQAPETGDSENNTEFITTAEHIKCSGLAEASSHVNLCSVSGLGSIKLKPEIDSQIWQLSDSSEAESLLGVSVNSSNSPANTPPNLLAQVLNNTQQPSHLLFAVMDALRTYFRSSYHGSPYRKPTLLLEVGENRSIDPEGSKLVQVLHTLNNNDRKTFQAIEADLKSLVDEIEFISTPIVQANKTTLEFHQQMDAMDDVSFNLRQMSSGTAQLLILLTQLHTAPANSLIMLEEVESMLHPGAQAKLTEILVAQSASKTIILSTHSPIIASQSNSKSINR